MREWTQKMSENTTKIFRKSSLAKGILANEEFLNESVGDVEARIRNDVDSVYELFREKWNNAYRNVRFASGQQWEYEEIVAHQRQNRIPYVFDQISSKVNALFGAHSVLRVESRAAAAEPGDEPAAAVANRLIKWFEQLNRLDEVEGQVFADMVVKAAGASVVRWEMTDTLSGRPVIERVPIYQLVWDGRAADIGLKDAKWMARIVEMTMQEALEEFPDFQEDIRNTSISGASMYYSPTDPLTPRQSEVSVSVDKLTGPRSVVRVIEHYEKVKQFYYVVLDEFRGEMTEFDEKKAAENYASSIMQAYTEGDIDVVNADGEDIVQIARLSKNVVVQSILIGNNCVSREVTQLPDFPYQIAFCYHDDGDYWSFVDLLIHPQIFLNRMISEWDNQIGRGSKHMTTVVSRGLAKDFTIEDFNREKSKTAPTIPVLTHDAIRFHPNQPAQQDIPSTIQLSIQHMTDIVGGKNALGLQENAAESGAAVRARQEAAGLNRLPIFEHLNQWRRKVVEMALWYSKNFLAANQQIRILGADDEASWLNIDQEALDTLANARVDIVVTEAKDTDTIRERQFQQMKELFMTVGPGAIPADAIFDTMLEYSNLPETSKNKIRNRLQSLQQYYAQQQQQQEEMKMQQQVERSLKKKQMKEQMEIQQAVQQP